MIDAESLDAAGYKKFPGGPGNRSDGYHALWQKTVKDENGVRYFISVREWRLTDVLPGYSGESPSFEPRVQFKRPDGGGKEQVFDVVLHGRKDMTIGEVEAFYAKQWQDNGCSYYERHAWSPSVP